MLALYSDKRRQQFFTDAGDIRALMIKLLGDTTGKKVLEPCAGHGAFIVDLEGNPATIDAIDVDAQACKRLRDLRKSNIRVQCGDFIDHFVSGQLFSGLYLEAHYDLVICNPPYGLRFSIEYRRTIKAKLPGLYARESYGLFIYFGVGLLRDGGRFVFIVPDTFLHSKNHTPLRQFLVQHTRLSHIVQFDSARFESVNFGYGNLCIIAGEKAVKSTNQKVRWVDVRGESARLCASAGRAEEVDGRYLVKHINSGWIYPAVRRNIAIQAYETALGEIAECRTGLYTGDNTRFCAYRADGAPRRANGHPIEWDVNVRCDMLTDTERRRGIVGTKRYVPLIRGGHREPFVETIWAVDWSVDAVSYYQRDKKARLQNAQFYFREGLAVPMVTSGRISASAMRNAVFDQGVVGIFPHDETHMDFLLIYLNSDYVSRTVKNLINPSANNSANYVKRIPVPRLSGYAIKEARKIVQIARATSWHATKSQRDSFVGDLLERLPDKILSQIGEVSR